MVQFCWVTSLCTPSNPNPKQKQWKTTINQNQIQNHPHKLKKSPLKPIPLHPPLTNSDQLGPHLLNSLSETTKHRPQHTGPTTIKITLSLPAPLRLLYTILCISSVPRITNPTFCTPLPTNPALTITVNSEHPLCVCVCARVCVFLFLPP